MCVCVLVASLFSRYSCILPNCSVLFVRDWFIICRGKRAWICLYLLKWWNVIHKHHCLIVNLIPGFWRCVKTHILTSKKTLKIEHPWKSHHFQVLQVRVLLLSISSHPWPPKTPLTAPGTDYLDFPHYFNAARLAAVYGIKRYMRCVSMYNLPLFHYSIIHLGYLEFCFEWDPCGSLAWFWK